jgi:AsmA protein
VRIAKWTSIIVGGIVLLLVVTVFVMTSVIDPNRYRGKLEVIVGDLAGRPLVIEGNLELTWYPWLGVRMGHARLENRPGVLGPPIAEWSSVAAAAKLLSLLKGQVVIDRIRLQSPHIRLRRDAQGHGNWEDLGPGTSSSPGTPSSPARQSSPPPQIAGVEIRDGTVEYVDEMTGLQVNLSSVEFDMGEWRAGQPLPVHTRFLAHSDSIPPSGVWVQVDAPELTVRFDPLNVETPELTARIADAQIKGYLACATLPEGGVSTHGSIALQVPSVRKLAHDLALDQTLPHDPTTLGPLELTSDWSYVAGALAVKPLALKLDGVSFDGWVQRSAPPKSAWRFELHGDRIDLDRYVNVDSTSKKPFELNAQGLRAVNANGSLVFDQADIAKAHLTDVRLRLKTAETQQ